MLDEWMSSGDMDMGNTNADDHSTMNMEGMDHRHMNLSGSDMSGHDMSKYDIYTINGKSNDSIEKLSVKEGDKVRIRLINAGYLSHQMHLHGMISKSLPQMDNRSTIRHELKIRC